MSESPDSTAHSIRWYGLTDTGRFRKNNEDAFLALTVSGEGVTRLGKYGEASTETNDFIFAVSDGMGGANAGEFASRIAVEKITALFPKVLKINATGLSVGFQDLLLELFEHIHRELTHLSFCYEELHGMGATLSLCWVRPGWLYFAHIGDSRIYRLPKDEPIRQITTDHTHVGWLLSQGQISWREARSHPKRNALQQVLGGKTQQINPQFGAIGYEPGDFFVICSDGLIEGIFDNGIERLIRRPGPMDKGNPAERLVRESVQTDGKDNTTALVFEAV